MKLPYREWKNSTKIKAERNTVTEKPDAKVKRKLPDKPTSIHTFEGRIQNFRERLAKAKEAGKDYFVMSYHINTTSYEIKN